jgi:hypothetical protein
VTRPAARALGLTVSIAGLAVSIASSGPAGAAAPPSFRHERPVVVEAPGPHALPIDVALLAGSRPFRVETHAGPAGRPARRVARGGLGDLRFYGSGGRELPYLLVEPPLPEPEWRRARPVLPVPPTKKESGFEADLGAAATVDRVRVEGLPTPLLKRLALDGSGDRRHWTRLVPEATLFDLPDSDLRQLELPFPPGAYRYLRVTWDDTSSARVPLPRAVAARVVRADAPARPASSVPVAFDRLASEPGTSRFRLRLAAPSLPVVALRLATGAPHLLRAARVTEARLAGAGAVPVRLGEATLKRAVRGAISADELRIPLDPPTTSQLELEIDDGDNPPLEVSGIQAELAELPWIYLEVGEPGSLVARWGNADLDAPRYDLESVRRQAEQSAPPAARWGTSEPARPFAAEAPAALPGTGPPIDAADFRYSRELPEGPAGLVAVPLDAAVLAHSSGRLRSDFADLRIVDEEGRQLAYLVERRPEPLVVPLPAPASKPEAAGRFGPGTSAYELKLPYAGLPPVRLVLRTSARVFDRHVEVLLERRPERRHRQRRAETVAGASWRHADAEAPAPPLSLNLPTLEVAQLLLAVREGDNAPLPLEQPELLLPSFQVRFFRPGAGRLRVLYGHERLPPPRYDLALLAPAVLASPAVEVALGAEEESTSTRPAILTPRAFWAILLAAAVVLLLLIGRLVVRAEPSKDA